MVFDNQLVSFVDGCFKFDMNIVSFNFGVWNNVCYFDMCDMLNWWVKLFKINMVWMKLDFIFVMCYIGDLDDYNSLKKVCGLYMNYQVDFFNFVFYVILKIVVGFFVKSWMIFNIDNIDFCILKLVENGFDFVDLWNFYFNDKLLIVNVMVWNEYGINYGQVFQDEGEYFFKVGGCFKFFQGLVFVYMYIDNVVYQVINDMFLVIVQGNFKYGYNEVFDQYVNGSVIFNLMKF